MKADADQVGNEMPSKTKTIIFATLVGLSSFSISSVVGQSITETLYQAYANSPTLEAARRDLAAAEELLPQARSGYFPQLDFSGAVGASNEFTDTQEEAFSANSNASLNLTQPLYRGGGTTAAVDEATNQVLAQEAILKNAEQATLLEAATTFMDLWRDQQVLDLTSETLSLLAAELESVGRQKDLGAATKTDVAQTEARLGGLEADQIDAETAVAGSQGQLQRLIDATPSRLALPDMALAIPANADEAIALTMSGNPELAAARFQRIAAEWAIDSVSAQYWPSVDLRSALQYFSADIQEGGGEIDDDVAIARVDLTLTIPLYRSASSSFVRQSRETARALERQEEDIRRRLKVDARGAWTRMKAARDQIERLEKAVDAADRVIEGTGREYQLGQRTTLDLLNARQDWLDLQIALTRVNSDLYVTQFELLALTGQLTIDDLELDPESTSQQ